VPLDEDGHEMYVYDDQESYSGYLWWLAGFICTQRKSLFQKALLADYRIKGVDHAVVDLSDLFGWSIMETEITERDSAEGCSFADYHQEGLDLWNKLSEEERQDYSKEDFFISPEDYARLGREFLESQNIPEHIHYAGIPYRAVLVLSQILH